MAIGMGLGWSNLATIALAVGLAYLFGFTLTALPLVRAGLAAGVVVSTALAADTVSITIMEVIDNAFVAVVPGALDAGIGDLAAVGERRRRLRDRLPLRLLGQPLHDRPR